MSAISLRCLQVIVTLLPTSPYDYRLLQKQQLQMNGAQIEFDLNNWTSPSSLVRVVQHHAICCHIVVFCVRWMIDLCCCLGSVEALLTVIATVQAKYNPSAPVTYFQTSVIKTHFLPHDAVHKRCLCSRPVSVRLSVRLCVRPSVCYVGVLYPDGWRYRQFSFSFR